MEMAYKINWIEVGQDNPDDGGRASLRNIGS
jgi:hypothetical protein